MQWSTLAAPSSTASWTPGPGPSWLPCTRSSSPARRPASSTVRASSPSKAYGDAGSQNTSIQRAYGAAASSISPGDQRDVVRASVPPLRRHHVGAEERRLGGDLAGQPQRPDLVGDAEAVPALDLHGGGPLGSHLGDPCRDQGAQLVVGGGPGRGHGAGDAAAVVRCAGHPGGELGRAVAGEDEVAVGVHEAGDEGPPAEIDLPVGGRCLRRVPDPGHPTVLDDHGRRRRRIPSRSSVLSSQVTSSAMPVIARADQVAIPPGRPGGGEQSGDVAQPVRPSRTTRRPPMITCRTSAAPAL